MKRGMLFLLVLFFSATLRAEFFGTLTATGGVGQYLVQIANDENAHAYNGFGVKVGGGLMRIVVKDSWETFVGTATEDEVGEYQFILEDRFTGKVITGTLQTPYEY